MKIPVTKYASLEQFIEGFKQGHSELVAVIGIRGLQKSMTVARICPEKQGYRHLSGRLTAFQFYRECWRNRDKDFVIDDTDGFYSDRAAVSLLKELCDTKPVKTLHWHSASTQLEKENIPLEFPTKSRVVLVANDCRALTANVGPLEDRGLVLLFTPTAKEVHQRVAEWFKDKEIYRFIGRHLNLIPQPSMRHYKHARELKRMKMDWRSLLLQSWEVDPSTTAVLRLLADKTLTQNQRAKRFTTLTGHDRATYYRRLKSMRESDNDATLRPVAKSQASGNGETS